MPVFYFKTLNHHENSGHYKEGTTALVCSRTLFRYYKWNWRVVRQPKRREVAGSLYTGLTNCPVALQNGSLYPRLTNSPVALQNGSLYTRLTNNPVALQFNGTVNLGFRFSRIRIIIAYFYLILCK